MTGFLPELLAWDALRQLILLLDKAIEVHDMNNLKLYWQY
jgi:hypothetical protein